tara:strand:+ start:314 stop:700 length:387 start_codon:yes stop_codon:yes gene_type:complete
MKKTQTISIIVLTFFFSCTTNFPKIDGMDYMKWKTDNYGCGGDRMNLIGLIHENKDKFLRFNQNQLIDILGKPDNQTLYTRGQTIFYYYIKYHQKCENTETRNDEENIKLEIRFDALNRSKEVYVHNY